MLHDRGRIKWVSLMLPEHVKLLRDWVQEDAYEQKQELDEHELEIMDAVMAEAVELERPVKICFYDKTQYKEVVGTIHSWDEINGILKILDSHAEVQRIRIEKISSVRLVD